MLIQLDARSRARVPATVDVRASESSPEIARLYVHNTFVFGPFELSAAERLLKRGHETVSIGGRALDLLITLVDRAGQVISHKELIARAWPDVTVEEANLRVHIAGLRKVLREGPDGARYISNVAGRGYCFVAVVARYSRSQVGPQAGQPVGADPKDEIAAARGQEDIGTELLRTALGALHSESHNLLLTAFASALTRGLLKTSEFDDALSNANGAIGQATALSATFHLAGLLHLKADAPTAALQKDTAAALDRLTQSLKVLRDQTALARELRLATMLARLLFEGGRREEARSVLAPVCDRFTEEFEASDLRDARALLASLA